MSWPLASMALGAMVAIAAIAIWGDGNDLNGAVSAILVLLMALGLGDLREIKTNTNGSNNTLLEQNKALMNELAEYRRNNQQITARALESAPLPPVQQSAPPTVDVDPPLYTYPPER